MPSGGRHWVWYIPSRAEVFSWNVEFSFFFIMQCFCFGLHDRLIFILWICICPLVSRSRPRPTFLTYWNLTQCDRGVVTLYLAVVLMLAGAAHADEQHWVSIERDGGEVWGLLGRGADAALNAGGALHREELGAGGGAPENKRRRGLLGLRLYVTKTCDRHRGGYVFTPCLLACLQAS